MTTANDHLKIDVGAAAELASVIRIVQATADEIPAAAIARIVLEIAPIRRTRRLLQLALEQRPHLLEGGHPGAPVTVQELCHRLVEAGASAVVLPVCESCGRQVRKMPHKAPGGGRHCSRCERNHRSTPCSRCGRERPIQRSIAGETLCRPCWWADSRSFDLCSRCGQVATIMSRRPELVCVRCYRAPRRQCEICHQDGPIATHLEGRRVCTRCYFGMRRPRACPECLRRRMLTSLRGDHLICAECAGEPVTLECPGCGSVSHSREHRLCDRCRHPGTIRRLLSDDTGDVPETLRPLEAYLLAHPTQSDSIERWVLKSHAARALRELVSGRLPLDARAIMDDLPTPQSAGFLLSLLAAAGLLPELDVHQARFERWLEMWLADIDNAQDRLLLQRYHKWGTNPVLRKPVSRPTSTPHRMKRLKSRLRQCALLLAHIRASGHTIATFPQRELDHYLTGSSSQIDALAQFTRWLRENRLTHLVVPWRRNGVASAGMDTEERWRVARRFLSDDTVPTIDRVAGLLTLLYGMQATRIVALERSDLQIRGDGMTLTIGTDPIELPEPVARAITDLLRNSARKSDRWLFPGRNPGAPMTAPAVSRRLHRYGLRIADARATSLLELARHMHPRVISDMLGLSTTAASRWWRLASSGWATYPTLR